MISPIKLIYCNEKVLKWILKGDDKISEKLGVKVTGKWTEFGMGIFQYALQQLNQNPESAVWGSYLPIHIMDNQLIGSCGYKGPPDRNGIVEIGYEVSKRFRRQGYATEIARQLIVHASQFPEVNQIRAHTLPNGIASEKVLRKCGFIYDRCYEDPEAGLVNRWVKQLK